MTESNNRQASVRHYIKRDTAQARAYSQAVVTKGGRIVWLAGQVGAADASGQSLAGDFDGQVREVFSRLGQTLEQADDTLADMVTMTVFITDALSADLRAHPAEGARFNDTPVEVSRACCPAKS